MAGYAGASSVSNPEGDLGTETSPDLLKNTPSNISRLEDVIEHCKGRRKYLARTSSPSDGEDVRWYFCKVPLAVKELAASIPRTEIVGKGDYFRFSMRDSLALEASFLQREEELLSYWWKEYAECSEGPRSSGVSSKSSSAFEDDSDGDLYAIDEERVGVPVKGGLYEVDLKKRHSFPVYWSGENRRVLRGHWFARKGNLDWLPVREDIAEQLELAYRCQVWHRRTFQPSGLFAARVDLQGIIQGLHALFTGEDDTWEAWLGTDHSGLSLNKGGGNGFKLRRGFAPSGFLRPTQDELRQQKEEEMDDYCSQVPVGHLVFMVHGIGQRLEKANLVDDVGNFRQITACLAERHLSPYQRSTQRVLFIPCQWRRGLRLSSESAVEKITLDGVRGLRETLGATVHDVLYYMSPIYCQDIIDSVSNQLNKLYQKFLKRNPGYNGKVSLYAHSLGSVLSYDILCHQESLTSPFPMEKLCNQVPEEPRSLTDTNTKIILGSETEKAKGPSAEIESRIPLEVETSLPYQDNTLQHDVNALCPAAPILMSAAEGGFPNAGDISSSGYLNEAEENHYEPLDTSLFNANLKSGLQSEQSNMETKLNQKYENFDGRTCSGPEGSSGNTLSKEETIKLLREELDILKIRINQLEQGSNIHGSNENTTNGNHKLVHGREEDCPMTSLFSQNKHPMGKGDQRKNYTPLIRYTKLGFKVDTFFAVGSPLGVFLALRNIRMGIGRGQEYWQDERITEEMPSCRQMFNIFHPFDPVAYRIEPLVCKEYISKRPVIIPYHRGGKRLHIGFQDFTEDLAARSHAVIGHLSTIKTKMVNMFRSGQTSNLEDSTESLQSEERSYGSLMMERLSSSENGRIDHMLQDKTFEHSYISALSSHTNYWRDFDTALFILKHLYRDIPEERSFDEELEGEGSKKVSGWEIELFFQNQALDEDTPLTFYGKFAVREFARRARKAMQSKKQ